MSTSPKRARSSPAPVASGTERASALRNSRLAVPSAQAANPIEARANALAKRMRRTRAGCHLGGLVTLQALKELGRR